MVHEVTTSDDEWYIEWQRMTTSDTTNGNEWQRVVQRVVKRMTTSGATNESKWEWFYVSEWNNYAV